MTLLYYNGGGNRTHTHTKKMNYVLADLLAPRAGEPSVPLPEDSPPSSPPQSPPQPLFATPVPPHLSPLADSMGNEAPPNLIGVVGTGRAVRGDSDPTHSRWTRVPARPYPTCTPFSFGRSAERGRVVDLREEADEEDALDDFDLAATAAVTTVTTTIDAEERSLIESLCAGSEDEEEEDEEEEEETGGGTRSPYFGGRAAPSRKRPRPPEEPGAESSAAEFGGGRRQRQKTSEAAVRELDEQEERQDLERLRNADPQQLVAAAAGQGESSIEGGGYQVHTDCLLSVDGARLPGVPPDALVDNGKPMDHGMVWCFGCQWRARGHRPVDNDKIRDLTDAFVSLILGGSTSLENTARIISDQYRRTIRQPSLAADRWLPDWPPAVVRRHIEIMIEPRVKNMLTLRRHTAMLERLSQHAFRLDQGTGEEAPNLPVIRAIYQGSREQRELYRQVPKESFGYNEDLRADSWLGGVLVHPSRVQPPAQRRGFAGAPVASQAARAGSRGSAVTAGGGDTGELRGPANDEELVRRPIHSRTELGDVSAFSED